MRSAVFSSPRNVQIRGEGSDVGIARSATDAEVYFDAKRQGAVRPGGGPPPRRSSSERSEVREGSCVQNWRASRMKSSSSFSTPILNFGLSAIPVEPGGRVSREALAAGRKKLETRG